MQSKICDQSNYAEIYEIYLQHKKIGGKPIHQHMSLEAFVLRITESNSIVHACFDQGKMISFMITVKSKALPCWNVIMYSCRRSRNMFDGSKNGMALNYDTAIKYWEDQGLNFFIFWQPSTHVISANTTVRTFSKELQRYTTLTMATVDKNTASDYTLLNMLINNTTYPVDLTFKISFRND